MLNQSNLELDRIAAPDGYVAPPSEDSLVYVIHFHKTCKRYQIDFATADSDERDEELRRIIRLYREMGLSQNKHIYQSYSLTS